MAEGANTGCEPLSASHMHLQWHNKDASRDLWTKTYAGAYVVNRNEIDGQDLAKVTSKTSSTHFPVNHHPIFW